MKVMAQIAMVMNLDKCIGCHTCSVTCKQAWTNREGTEYMWFNNVETRPGVGYPQRWEDQDHYKGGWVRKANGKVVPRQGGRLKGLSHIFANPHLPEITDYYEPWTYEYDKLLSAPRDSAALPVARTRSQITGEYMDAPTWGPNWDDDLGGSLETMHQDPMIEKSGARITAEIDKAFMFYLPRICEHCLNPTCVSVCPSGAMYKRSEDGIVLVDEDKCRGWRMCVSGCPYKKVYFNHVTGKAEKCTLCYPRLEIGQPTVCSETCVGRLRYLGVLLYDADRVGEVAATENEQDLYQAQCDILLDPTDSEVIDNALNNGVPRSYIEAAQKSPIYALIHEYKVALPLHPEFRTLPMVWYVPPLSPIVDEITANGADGEDAKILFTTISRMRIPLEYLASLFTAGNLGAVELSLRRLAAMRSYMRDIHLGNEPREEIAHAVGMSGARVQEMYRLLAIAKYDDRYVIPTTHPEIERSLDDFRCSLDGTGGVGMGGPQYSGRKVVVQLMTRRPQ